MTTPDGDPEPQVRTENLLWNAVLRLSRLSVAYGVGRVSTKALSVLLVPIYIRYLTPADLGIVATATLTAGIVGLVGKLHQDASVLRFYYDYRDAREDLGRFLGGVMCLVIAAPLAVVAFLLLAGGSIAQRVLPEIPFRPYLLYALLTALLTPLATVAITLYRVREQAGRYAAVQVGSFLLTTAFILYFVVLSGEGALGQIKGTLLGAVGLFLVGLVLMAREVRFPPPPDHLRATLAYGLPLIPQGLADWVIQGSDRFFLARYSTLAAVGLYSVSYTIAGLVHLFVFSIYQAFVPFFFSIVGDREEAGSLIPRLFTYFLLAVSLVTLLVGLHAGEVVWLLGNPSYSGAAPLVPILASAYLFSPFIFVGSSQILSRKRSCLLVWIILAAGVLNLALNFALIPPLGELGAAAATWLTYGGHAALIWWWSRRLYPLPLEYGRIGRLLVLTVGCLAVASALGTEPGGASLLLRESLIPAFFFVLLLSGFFDARDRALLRHLMEQVGMSWALRRSA